MSGFFSGLVTGGVDLHATIQTVTNGLQSQDDKASLAQFTDSFTASAISRAPSGLPATDFAFILAAICWRESRAGAVLKPRGVSGTGDNLNRWLASPPDWADELGLVTGNQKTSSKGTTLYEVKAPAFANAQFPGWGYGLMQIDFASYKDWLAANDWTDPSINIDKGAQIFVDGFNQVDSLLAAVCAYNAGASRAGQASNPDSVTTGGNYGSDVLTTALSFGLNPSLYQPAAIS